MKMGSQTTLRTGLWAVCALALGAATVAGYLAWATWNSSPIIGCGEQSLFDCSEVISGRWSKWLGMPVSLLGAITYALLFCVSFGMSLWARALNSAWTWLCLALLAMLAAGAAIWFFIVQALVLGEFCLYCCLVHACGLISCLLVLWILPRGDREEQQARMGVMLGIRAEMSGQTMNEASAVVESSQLLGVVLVAVAGWVALVLGQWFADDESFIVEMATPKANAEGAMAPSLLPARSVEIDEPLTESIMEFVPAEKAESSETSISQQQPTGLAEGSKANTPEDDLIEGQSHSGEPAHQGPIMIGGMQVDVHKLPVLGNPKAKHVLVELMDYTCRHCQHFHHMLANVLQRYGDQVAIVIRPAALSPKCNPYVTRKSRDHADACEYSKLALAVWRMDPDKFPSFHDWLLDAEKIPSISVAKKRAVRLVGTGVLLREINGSPVREMLDLNNQILHGTKKGLPILITPAGSLSGVPKSDEQLFELLEQYLGMTPVSQASLPGQDAAKSGRSASGMSR
jgi:uncharacterized membrane protein/protein-disulfide isomerase